MSSIAHLIFFICRRSALLLVILLLPLASSSASASGIDDFAARLLCEADPDCEVARIEMENAQASANLVILGITLPENAARDRDNEQEALVAQGSYLSVDGDVLSLVSESGEVIFPERGVLSTRDYGSATSPSSTPIIITLPGKGRDHNPN